MAKHILVDTIDRAYKDQHPERNKPFRPHLGGSMIGKKCERELYYSFRWFKRPAFEGRMLRLFDRGHNEEFRFIAYLRSVGIEVLEYSERLFYHPESDTYITVPARFTTEPPQEAEIEATCEDVTSSSFHLDRAKARGTELKQWRISDVMGHFGGSLDGISMAPFDIELSSGQGVIPAGTKFLNEFKTHNTKSFVNLVSAPGGVKEAKPVHWAQMQIYMHKKRLRFALYMAVNKNDDDLYVEVIEYAGAEVGEELLEKARKVIHTKVVPNRIGKHPSWFECKFCEYADICHYGDKSKLDRNCRTCQHSTPVDDGRWHCSLWNALIPVDAVLAGCDNHKAITD